MLTLPVAPQPTEALRQQLLAGLRAGTWPAGSRLPTERALCAQFGMSRSTLRRVLRELRELGLIVQKVGSGTYVAETLPRPIGNTAVAGRLLSVPPVSPTEVMEARLLLEPVIVDLVVANATTEDFERMVAACERGEQAQSLEEFERCDSALHEQLALATHNALFISIFKLLADLRNSGEWGGLRKKILTTERRLSLQKEHRRIVEALRARDSEQARRHIFDHVVQARVNLLWRS